jgi:cytochrome c biogenesis protein CcmG/thiol:disulfide interchange protein DsbE
VRSLELLLAATLSISISAVACAECSVDPQPANFDFTLKDMHGNDVALADYEGDVILIDFWATWCAPCRIEIPGFIEMVEEYGDQGFSVLGISIDDPPDALQSYAAEMGMNYPVLIGDGRDDVKDEYGPIIGFPTAVIVDRDGNICHRHIGFSPKEAFVADIEGLL